MEQIKKHLEQLKKKLNQWSKEYYTLDSPTVDDLEYDLVMQELKKIENEHPELITNDSPTQKVGHTISDKFEKVAHKIPMLSLADVFSWEEVENFNNQIAKQTKTLNNAYYAELKIDGLSISLNYENGKLITATTRGDGVVGENVINNVKTIKSIPWTIPDQNHIEVRGEIFFLKKEFEKINNEKLLNQEPLFANPRNAAAGTIRQLDSSIVASRNLDAFLYYYFSWNDNKKIHTQQDALLEIEKQGLKVNKEGRLCNNLEELKAYIDEYTNKRDDLDYEIDGIVIKLNDFNLYDKIGYTAKTPKWAIAYKFPAEIKETKLLDIFPSVGRTGKITYNAKVESVQLAGTKVTAATLNNAEWIETKDLRVGATVKIKKAGDIIPGIISVVKNSDYQKLEKWSKAEFCPACKTKLEKTDNEVDQFCVNFSCPAQILRSLEHFASRGAMNIVGLGSSTLNKFFEEKIICSIDDIYKIEKHKAEIINFEKMGGKSYENLIQSIEDSKNRSFEKVLFGLGIRHVGSKIAKVLAKTFGNIENLKNADFETLSTIDSIGEVLAQSIINWFTIEENIRLINELKEDGVNFNYLGEKTKTNPLITGKTFVITGTLSKSRDSFKQLIELNGGKISDSVSSKTNFVLVGDNAGSKAEKATKLKIKIINEQEFDQMIGEYENEE
ncbi:NAD-dependent DNA ligase [Williamsoniiplasma luminosum]|uniref:DNA ligase n=1 Tax=Williamsoniiplasma luminosum TaxID=214888 RepID=A0A2K8NSN0_9MOLU|nr:NAD-dependent DNA ligase LigA [Williamsoniiplasma luminosum]ATZ16764.1 NAD-dependent DNA ligase [Williamsoniiplasma luminosum]